MADCINLSDDSYTDFRLFGDKIILSFKKKKREKTPYFKMKTSRLLIFIWDYVTAFPLTIKETIGFPDGYTFA